MCGISQQENKREREGDGESEVKKERLRELKNQIKRMREIMK